MLSSPILANILDIIGQEQVYRYGKGPYGGRESCDEDESDGADDPTRVAIKTTDVIGLTNLTSATISCSQGRADRQGVSRTEMDG